MLLFGTRSVCAGTQNPFEVETMNGMQAGLCRCDGGAADVRDPELQGGG